MGKKDKKQHKAHEKGNNNSNTIHTDDDSAVNVSIPKSGKRKRDSVHNTSLNASETFKENIVKSKSKKRRKESSSLPENESTNFTSETIESQPAKKSKKDKKKKIPTTLGVVDVDILQQAEINFQVQADYIASLNSEEPVKKKKHSKKTKSVSFKELVEVTDFPSAKKKHTKLKDQDLMLEEATDSNENKQHSKKRKLKKIEVEIAPSDDLVGVNENKSEESTKKKRHKEKKEKVVSSEKLNKINEDGSERPLKKKKNNKKEGKLTAAPPEEDTATSLKEGHEMDKNEKALQYLKLWQSSKSVWKFNKMLQIHLLNIMYDTSLLSDEDFQILLQYLDGLKGKGREKTKEDALKIFNNGEKTEVNTEKEDRARQLCQMLA